MPQKRESWSSRWQLIFSTAGYCVGLGNIWRFPYLCAESGGGAFLIPYFIITFILGTSLFYLEQSIGQMTQSAPIKAFKKLKPELCGVGLGNIVITFLLASYYMTIVAWGLRYLIVSVGSIGGDLPWNGNATDYWEKTVLDFPENGFENGILNGMNWYNFGLLATCWFLLFISTFKGIIIQAKIANICVILPYIFLVALLIRNCLTDGAIEGIKYFIIPEWSELLNPSVWSNAATQVFNSIGICFGCLIVYGSYNKIDNDEILGNMFAIIFLNSFTSILSGFVIFSAVGNLDAINPSQNISDITAEGIDLIFTVYPEVFGIYGKSGVAWSILFFLCIVLLGYDTMLANVEAVISTILDQFVQFKRSFVSFFVILTLFLFSIPTVFDTGIYYFKIMDAYTCSVSLMVLASCEILGVCWWYGSEKLRREFWLETGNKVPKIFVWSWKIVCPVVVLIILVATCLNYQTLSYKDYVYPVWANVYGWCVVCLTIFSLPLFWYQKLFEKLFI